MTTTIKGVERAAIDHKQPRGLPAWLKRQKETELAEAATIACPRARRLREIEIDIRFDAIELENLEQR